MSCKRTKKLLPLYVGEDLDAPDLEHVKDHLKSCLACNREYQDHLKARRSLEELAHKPDLSRVMAGFTDEVLERIAADPSGPSAPVPRLIHAYMPRALAAAAMLLVAVTAGIYFLRGEETPVVDSGPVAHETEAVQEGEEPRRARESVSPLNRPNPTDLRWVADNIHRIRGNRNAQAREEEKVDKYPDLEPLPQSFPKVQPVNLNRNF